MKIYKTLLVGCGNITAQWLPPILARQDCELVGLVDLNEQTARACAERNSLEIPVFTDLTRAIRETGAELVLDLTIPAAHKKIVTTALREGCHVFGEKPMAETLEDAQEMVDLSEKTGQCYAVLQNYRYNQWPRTYKNMLTADGIGSLGCLYADFFVGPRMPGFREMMDSPLLLDMAIHTFDTARFLVGADPVSVWCREFNPLWSWFKGNASAIAVFEFANGVIFEYRGSWCAEGKWTSWNSSWRAQGEKGSALWLNEPVWGEGACGAFRDRLILTKARVGADLNAWWNNDNWEDEQIAPDWTGIEGHGGCLDEMFTSLHEQRPAETDCRDNIKSVAMVLAARQSSLTGQTVKVTY
ncbi:Gfo/Idh/MocA family oxidoreductase [Kamptonema cortianum]|nr:Gfo/Idh/MocA family oxidoreductase [Kamptonema cortianum]